MAEETEVKSDIVIQPENTEKKEIATEPITIKKEGGTFTDFLKKNWFWILIIVLLAAILIFNVFLRTQNVNQLKDITTGNYTLGPDLDPFLYLRLAKDIVAGTLHNPDMFRQAPLGAPNYAESVMMPNALVLVYRILSIFLTGPKASIEYAAIISPVIFFTISTILFFLFIMVIFSFKMSKKKSAIIALIASLFYVVAPEMLHRTVAGIPEIESLGMLWFWAAFLFFALSWKSDKIKKQAIFGVLSGIFTGAMMYTWGGYRYIFMTFALASFLIFLFNKEKKKNFLIYCSWYIPALIIAVVRDGPAAIKTISDVGFGFGIFLILILNMVLFSTKLKKINEKIRLPESIITLIIGIILALISALIINPSLISGIFSKIIGGFLNPFGVGRVGLTVAENSAPYFVQVFGSFSWLFWFFFAGLILMFYKAVEHFETKKKVWMSIFFVIFLVTFIFSRYSPSSLLNGENFLSKLLYFGGLIIFIIFLLGMYISAYVKRDERTLEDFKKIDFSYLLLIAFSFWMIVSMRGAIRLFFIISPAVAIISSYLPVEIFETAIKQKEKSYKFLLFAVILLLAILLIVNFVNFEKTTSQEAKDTVNGAYYQQWQKAMAWARTDTPENSIFVSWWDYGYWIQTLGERPTVTDGGHANNFWDHSTARYLMTAQNEKTALQLCKAYNVSYFLIDSTDIGKYSAFSSIGSDATGTDRLSWVSTFTMNTQQTQETKNETIYVYTGGTMLDEDISWNGNFFPMSKAGIGAFLLTVDSQTQQIIKLNAVMIYNNQQYVIPIKYMWINGQITQINQEGLDSMFYFVPSIDQSGLNNLGAGLYLSEKALNTEWVRLYLLDETKNFELVHNEPSLFVQQLRENYNLSVGDILVAGGQIQGPIKIWKVNYPNNITYYPEYLERGTDVNPGQYWTDLDYLGT